MPRKPRHGGPNGRPPHVATDKNKGFVLGSVAAGLPHKITAMRLGISDDTLARHYRNELDNGLPMANAQVAHTLYTKATSKGMTGPSITAAIWWDKTRNKQRETSEHRLAGADGGPIRTIDLSKLTDVQLAALEPVLAALASESGEDQA